MATTQQMQEARDLMKTQGLTLQKAVSQVVQKYNAPAPIAPVAWQPPPVTPVVPPVAPPVEAKAGDTVTWVNWEKFVQANNKDMTTTVPPPVQAPPVQAPVIPTPTPTPNLEKDRTVVSDNAKVQPVDYNTSVGRESQIQDNVTKLTQQNPTLLKDRNAYNQAYWYETADQGKKAILDASFSSGQAQPITASSLYNLIASKQEIPLEQKNTWAYRVANNRYQRVNQYINMTASEIDQAFSSGKLIEWGQTFEDLKMLNPKLAQDAINLRKVNGNKTNIFTYVNNPDWTKVKQNNLEKNFSEQYADDHTDIIELLKSVYNTPTFAEMQAQINTPEVKSVQDKATAIEWEMNSLQTAMDNIDKDVENELAWTGATKSRIALEKASRKEEIQKQYDSKLREYTTQFNKATALINQNTEMYKYTQEQNKTMQWAIADIYKTQYSSELQKENARYQNTLNQSNASFQTIGDKVYKVQNGQMVDTGIKAERDASYQVVGWRLLKIKWDSITDTGISAITPETPKSPEWKQDASGNWYNANSSTNPWVQTSSLSPTAIAQYSTRLQGNNVQCGMVSNDYASVKFPWAPRMGDTYDSKIATITAIWEAPIPQVWALFVMDTGTSTWHTGIVASVNQDWTFTATDANRSGNKNGWPLQTSTYKISDKVRFSNAPAGTGVQSSWAYNSDDYFNVLFNSLPAGAKDNAGEVKRIREASTKYMNEGISPNQALLRFKWFKLTDESNADLWAEYVSIGDNLGTLKPASYETTVAKYINSWDYKGLNTYVNKLADDRAKQQYGADTILSSNVKVWNDRTDKLVSLINKNKDKIGAFDGYVSDFLQKFSNDPEYQQIKTILQMSQADSRKYFAWSAVTETEMKALQDFIWGTTKMTPENLVTMLQTLKDDRTNVYQSQRQWLLPPDTKSVEIKKKTGISSWSDFTSQLVNALK